MFSVHNHWNNSISGSIRSDICRKTFPYSQSYPRLVLKGDQSDVENSQTDVKLTGNRDVGKIDGNTNTPIVHAG
jgi:hypothetical protein